MVRKASYLKVMANSLIFHDRLSRPHYDVVKHVAISMNIELTHTSISSFCNPYQLAKAHRLHVTYVHSRSLHYFDIIHINL